MDNTLKPCKQLTSLDPVFMVKMLFPLEMTEKASKAFKKKPIKSNIWKLLQTLMVSVMLLFLFLGLSSLVIILSLLTECSVSRSVVVDFRLINTSTTDATNMMDMVIRAEILQKKIVQETKLWY